MGETMVARGAQETTIARGAYVFVAAVFTILGLAFLASTASVILEFQQSDWLDILVAHSHLFLFFPTLGLLSLVAFYLPSVIFTDLYWHGHVKPFGRQRYIAGLVVVLAGSLYFANSLQVQSLRGIWEVSPAALKADEARGAQPVQGCSANGQTCQRLPIAATMRSLRTEGQKRNTISDFARACKPDPFLEEPTANRSIRHCFPAGQKLSASECCKVQEQFAGHVTRQWSGSVTRSRAAELDVYLLPFKVFFVIVLIVIGILLTFWRRKLDELYGSHIPALERGVVIGAIAMLFWPVMDYGYQQTSDVLFGRMSAGPPLRLSLVIGPWAALLIFYFMKRFGQDLERVAQISTIAASAVAVLRYQEINDWSARLLGSGASWWHFLAFPALMLVGILVLVWPLRRTTEQSRPGSSGPFT